MKTRSIYVSVLLGAAAIVGGSLAIAQPAAGTDNPGGTAATDTESAKTEKSPEEVLEASRFVVDRIEATADNIARMLKIAREQKDVVKTLCLDDKLNQVDVAVRSANDRLAIIQAGVNAKSGTRLSHDEAVLGALGDRAQELAVEANQCIGEEAGVDSESELEVSFSPNLPEGQVVQSPSITSVSVAATPPSAASPIN